MKIPWDTDPHQVEMICVCVLQEQGQRYYGDLCQCDDFSCPEDKGQLCGGKQHFCDVIVALDIQLNF